MFDPRWEEDIVGVLATVYSHWHYDKLATAALKEVAMGLKVKWKLVLEAVRDGSVELVEGQEVRVPAKEKPDKTPALDEFDLGMFLAEVDMVRSIRERSKE